MSNDKDKPQGTPQGAAGVQTGNPNTVVVGCKLPNGIVMELGTPGDDRYESYRLNGSNAAEGAIVGLNGRPVEAGFGLTRVPRAFFEAWNKKHARKDFMRNGVVFVHDDEASARDHARDLDGSVKSGLEALNPADAPKGVEVDMAHLKQGGADVAQFRRAASR